MLTIMACRHKTCQCEIEGCGITHATTWTPSMHISINGQVMGGDDPADCMAHYLLSLGYPRDTPEHLRGIAEAHAAKSFHGRRVGPDVDQALEAPGDTDSD